MTEGGGGSKNSRSQQQHKKRRRIEDKISYFQGLGHDFVVKKYETQRATGNRQQGNYRNGKGIMLHIKFNIFKVAELEFAVYFRQISSVRIFFKLEALYGNCFSMREGELNLATSM